MPFACLRFPERASGGWRRAVGFGRESIGPASAVRIPRLYEDACGKRTLGRSVPPANSKSASTTQEKNREHHGKASSRHTPKCNPPSNEELSSLDPSAQRLSDPFGSGNLLVVELYGRNDPGGRARHRRGGTNTRHHVRDYVLMLGALGQSCYGRLNAMELVGVIAQGAGKVGIGHCRSQDSLYFLGLPQLDQNCQWRMRTSVRQDVPVCHDCDKWSDGTATDRLQPIRSSFWMRTARHSAARAPMAEKFMFWVGGCDIQRWAESLKR